MAEVAASEHLVTTQLCNSLPCSLQVSTLEQLGMSCELSDEELQMVSAQLTNDADQETSRVGNGSWNSELVTALWQVACRLASFNTDCRCAQVATENQLSLCPVPTDRGELLLPDRHFDIVLVPCDDSSYESGPAKLFSKLGGND